MAPVKPKIFANFIVFICAGLLALTGLELSMRLAGKLYLKWQNPHQVRDLGTKNEIRIMCVGESTTAIGFGDSYPATLERMLNAKYPEKNFVVINEGVSGSNSQKIVESLEEKIKKYHPHMVISMMGINDYWYLVLKADKKINTSQSFSFFKELKIYKAITYFFLNLENKKNIQQIYNQELLREKLEILAQKDKTNPENFYNLAEFYYKRKEFSKAQDYLNKVIQLGGSKNSEYLKTLGFVVLISGNSRMAEKYFDEYGVKLNQAKAYIDLAIGLFGDEKKANTKLVLKYINLSRENNPSKQDRIDALRILLYIHSQIPEYRNSKLAKKYYDELFSLYPDDIVSLQYLADSFLYSKEPHLAEKYIKKGLEKINIKNDPNSWWVEKTKLWEQLLLSYDLQERHKEADQLEKDLRSKMPNIKYWQRAPNPNSYYQALVQKFVPHEQSPEVVAPKATELNYRKALKIMRSYGVIPVAMQYPNRDIAPLKEMLKGEEDVIFVDNNLSFKMILKTLDYEDLFTDHFGGDTGHYTPRGAQLVAKQIIKTFEKARLFKNNSKLSKAN